MKALNELQKQAYEVVEEWLRPQMMDTKIIYMSDCPAPELKHLPIRGLSAMVQRLNKKLDVNYKLGAEDTREEDARKVMVVEDGVKFDDVNWVVDRHIESWDVGEESLKIVRLVDGTKWVVWTWHDGGESFEERMSLETADRELAEDYERDDLARLIREYQSREA